MQPSLTTRYQPEPENKCPECLYLKLEGTLVQPESRDHFEFWQPSTQRQRIDLHLTIHFNEQWESLKEGRVKFGLKGGELRLTLENTEFPFESRELTGSIQLASPNKRQEPEASQQQRGVEYRIWANNGDSNGHKTGSPVKVNRSADTTKTEQVQTTVCHITTKVSEENPAWIFEEESGKPVLKGLLENAKLGTLNAIALPCRVEATFEVSKRDLCLTDAEGLWPSDISRNKKAVLARLIVQRLLAPKFQPYLSRAELHYD